MADTIEIQLDSTGTKGYLALKPGSGTTEASPGVPLYENIDGRIEPYADSNASDSGHVTVSSSNLATDVATALTAPDNHEKILLQVFDQNIRVRMDGVDPTTSTGFQFAPSEGMIALKILEGNTLRIVAETDGASIQYMWSK